jgi:nucleotide-binding universal stress UspA family protein
MRDDSKRGLSRAPAFLAPTGFRSLVVPIDFTPSSDRVLRRVSLLPRADDARVTLLHVVPGNLTAGEQRGAERDAGRALAEEQRHLRKSLTGNVRVETLVKVGGAANEIGACATRAKADLIVMGRGGGRALREAFLGSTAERVIRKARLAVLVVGRSPRTAYGRPVLALDIDRAAHEVVRIMLLLLPPPRPRVEVVHAFGVPYPSLIYGSRSGDEILEIEDVFRRKATQELTRQLASALPRNVPPEDAPSWRIHVQYGSARAVVGRAIRKTEIDLLMLGTRGYSGVAYAFLGTVAGDLLRKASCDVVVVPPAPSRR